MYENPGRGMKGWTIAGVVICIIASIIIGVCLFLVGMIEGTDELIWEGFGVAVGGCLLAWICGLRMATIAQTEINTAYTAKCMAEMAKSVEKLSGQVEELMKKVDTAPTTEAVNEAAGCDGESQDLKGREKL